MIPVDWIRMFSARELQLLISGDQRSITQPEIKIFLNLFIFPSVVFSSVLHYIFSTANNFSGAI